MKVKAYVCSKDAEYHIPDDYNGVHVYFSEKSIKAHAKCVNDTGAWGCKIVEIELELPDPEEDGGV